MLAGHAGSLAMLCWQSRPGSGRVASGEAARRPPAPAEAAASWPMFGGTISRNMANPTEKNIPDDWSVKKGKEKNIKWSARLGSMAYGGPVVAGGKIFVGTNNE